MRPLQRRTLQHLMFALSVQSHVHIICMYAACHGSRCLDVCLHRAPEPSLGLHIRLTQLLACARALCRTSVFMHSIRFPTPRFTEHRPRAQVAEATAFTDSLKQASVMGLLDATAGGMVVYPSFSRHSSSGEASPKDADESHSDPRQLFFESAGDQIVQDEGTPCFSSIHLDPHLSTACMPHHRCASLGSAGCLCVISAPFSGNLTLQCAGELCGSWVENDELFHFVAEPSPSGKGAERPALFLRRASTGRLWFNTSLIRSTRRQQQYRWAGWLLGQCFANRASVCLPLPELLFDKLLKGPTFQVPPSLPLPSHAVPENLAASCFTCCLSMLP